MGFAVHVQCRCFRIVTEANGAVLVSHASERDTLSNVQVSTEQALMTLVTMH